MPFNDWRRLLEKLARMGDSAAWWIGDCLVYGERYRRDYQAWFEQFDRANESLRVYHWVAARVDAVTRVTALRWTHHRLVARLEPEQQAYWLAEAQRHAWTTRELEQALAEGAEPRPLALTVRAVGELRELCVRAAASVGLDAATWAAVALEQAARQTLAMAEPA
jgi:hypothetical protein